MLSLFSRMMDYAVESRCRKDRIGADDQFLFRLAARGRGSPFHPQRNLTRQEFVERFWRGTPACGARTSIPITPSTTSASVLSRNLPLRYSAATSAQHTIALQTVLHRPNPL